MIAKEIRPIAKYQEKAAFADDLKGFLGKCVHLSTRTLINPPASLEQRSLTSNVFAIHNKHSGVSIVVTKVLIMFVKMLRLILIPRRANVEIVIHLPSIMKRVSEIL